MTIVVLGSNPSSKSPDNSAFSTATKSGREVRSWFADYDIVYMNIVDEPTINNKPLSIPQIQSAIPQLEQKLLSHKTTGIVLLGAAAVTASRMLRYRGLNVPTLQLAHPSGRCRTWNSADARMNRDCVIRTFLDDLGCEKQKGHANACPQITIY